MPLVLVNGCFDILHRGHICMLAHAKRLSGIQSRQQSKVYYPDDGKVIVLIDSDKRVQRLKGTGRPINKEEDRQFALESLRYVDKVCIFNTDRELETLIKYYAPDIMVKGSDWKGKLIIGSEYCKSIVYYDIIEGYSTTKAIKDIVDRGCL